MPAADRNQFAVEISLPAGTAVERTAQVADSVEHILRRDPRVVSVTSFKGCSSPRFQNSYAPQIAGTNYAQFIVNTTGVEETVQLLDEYTPCYTDAFPDARVRFKQLTYSEAVYPVEFRLSGENLDTLRRDADKLLALMRYLLHNRQRRPSPGRERNRTDEPHRIPAAHTGFLNPDHCQSGGRHREQQRLYTSYYLRHGRGRGGHPFRAYRAF